MFNIKIYTKYKRSFRRFKGHSGERLELIKVHASINETVSDSVCQAYKKLIKLL